MKRSRGWSRLPRDSAREEGEDHRRRAPRPEESPVLIESLGRIDGIEDISLTTNGLLLKQLARTLASAGLNRVNVSLDSLYPERYRRI